MAHDHDGATRRGVVFLRRIDAEAVIEGRGDVVRGDLGRDAEGRSISAEIARRLVVSLPLARQLKLTSAKLNQVKK